MLRSLKKLEGYRILATDGEIGKVDDFYFDDSTWTVCYIVVNTGPWLLGRHVLLSPVVLGRLDPDSRDLPANLTIQEVKDGPDADTDRPVSDQQEERLAGRYGWPMYWSTAGTLNDENVAMGLEMVARARLAEEVNEATPKEKRPLQGNPHLRSIRKVTGYAVESQDGPVGHVGDFVIDDRSWVLRYVVVDMGRLLSAKKVLVAIEWVDEVSWPLAKVRVHLTEQAIRESPAFDPAAPVNRETETRLYDYYGRPRGREDGTAR